MQKLLKATSIMSASMVFIMMATAFIISFDVLRKVVIEVGVTTQALSYLFPVIIDGAILIFSFSALRNSIVGESIVADMCLVGLFTIGSVGMNILHAPENTVSRTIAAIAPLALLFSTERLIAMVKSEVKRSGLFITLEQVKNRIEEMKRQAESMKRETESAINEMKRAAQEETDAMKRAMATEKATLQDELTAISDKVSAAGMQLSELEAKRDAIKNEIDTLRTEKRLQMQQMPTQNDALELANETRQAQIDKRRDMLIDLVRQQAGLSYSKLGETLGVSIATVKRDVDDLMASGMLHRNGNGLEIAM